MTAAFAVVEQARAVRAGLLIVQETFAGNACRPAIAPSNMVQRAQANAVEVMIGSYAVTSMTLRNASSPALAIPASLAARLVEARAVQAAVQVRIVSMLHA
jgi:hypothetical protein